MWRFLVPVGAALMGASAIPIEGLAAAAPAKACAPEPTSPLVINVRDKGAKGDGLTDDTRAIQAAINEVAGTGGTVLVPDGTYLVNAAGAKHLKLKSDMTFKLAAQATLKAIPTQAPNYAVLDIVGASNVTVSGGTLLGERNQHKGKSGQGGMGIRILRGSKQITISGVTAKDMWGDGFYVKGASDVTFCGVTALRNRRQGMSVIEVDGLLITHSTFSNTYGTRPSAGIDFEPDRREQTINRARIFDSHFTDNAGAGIQLHGKKSTISNLEIKRNVFKNNRPIKMNGDYAALMSAICGNRYISEETVAGRGDGLYAYGEPVKMMHQDEGWVVTLNGSGACSAR